MSTSKRLPLLSEHEVDRLLKEMESVPPHEFYSPPRLREQSEGDGKRESTNVKESSPGILPLSLFAPLEKNETFTPLSSNHEHELHEKFLKLLEKEAPLLPLVEFPKEEISSKNASHEKRESVSSPEETQNISSSKPKSIIKLGFFSMLGFASILALVLYPKHQDQKAIPSLAPSFPLPPSAVGSSAPLPAQATQEEPTSPSPSAPSEALPPHVELLPHSSSPPLPPKENVTVPSSHADVEPKFPTPSAEENASPPPLVEKEQASLSSPNVEPSSPAASTASTQALSNALTPLSEELALLRKARGLKNTNAKEAVRLLNEHKTKFPVGALASERDMLWIELLQEENPKEASLLAKAWLKRDPETPFRFRLTRILERTSPHLE